MKCCNRVIKEHKEEIILFDVGQHINRFIRVYDCTHCGRERAELRYYDQEKGKFIYDTPKAKHTKDFIEKFKKEKYLTNVITHIKIGSKGNMNWLYQNNGAIYDFNGVNKGRA